MTWPFHNQNQRMTWWPKLRKWGRQLSEDPRWNKARQGENRKADNCRKLCKTKMHATATRYLGKQTGRHQKKLPLISHSLPVWISPAYCRPFPVNKAAQGRSGVIQSVAAALPVMRKVCNSARWWRATTSHLCQILNEVRAAIIAPQQILTPTDTG